MVGSGENGTRKFMKATLLGPHLCMSFMFILNVKFTILDG
jgi:hypothetical protein